MDIAAEGKIHMMGTETPVRIAVTGVAGRTCYNLLFRMTNGSLLGSRPTELRLLEITPALRALEGVVVGLDNCTFPNLKNVVVGDDPKEVFGGVSLTVLVDTTPRRADMERDDLPNTSGAISTAQGKALNEVTADSVRVLVTGSPADTNALIVSGNAPDIPKERFDVLTHLDHNHTKSQLTQKLDCSVEEIKKMTIWGNHPSTQYPDIFHAGVGGKNAAGLMNDKTWIGSTFIPTVTEHGTTIIKARGLSSAASTASVTVEHVCGRILGAPDDDWVSMAISSDGSYGVAGDVISSFPRVAKSGEYEIVQDLEINPFSRTKISTSIAELLDERKAVRELSLV